MVLEQVLGKTGQIGLKSGPVFPLNSRRLFQKLKFWNSRNSIILIIALCDIYGTGVYFALEGRIFKKKGGARL
jgi:hypothetical protein